MEIVYVRINEISHNASQTKFGSDLLFIPLPLVRSIFSHLLFTDFFLSGHNKSRTIYDSVTNVISASPS